MRFLLLITLASLLLFSSDFKTDINKTLVSEKKFKDEGWALGDVFKIFKSKTYLNHKDKEYLKIFKLSKKYNSIVDFVKSMEFNKKYKKILKTEKCPIQQNVTKIIYNKKSAIIELNEKNVFTYFIIELNDKKLNSYFEECEVLHLAPVERVDRLKN